MGAKCPGSNRNISSELIECPRCGMKVELFSDEMKRSCPGCKQMVFHETLPACAAWCAYAKECIDASSWIESKKKQE